MTTTSFAPLEQHSIERNSQHPVGNLVETRKNIAQALTTKQENNEDELLEKIVDEQIQAQLTSKILHTTMSDYRGLLHFQENISGFDDLRRYINPGERVLELGCGKGFTLHDITQVYDVQGLAVDLSNFLDVEVKQNDRIRFYQLDINSDLQQIKSNAVDFIYSFFTFQYLTDPIKVLGEVYRILKPGKTAFIDLGFVERLHTDFTELIERNNGNISIEIIPIANLHKPIAKLHKGSQSLLNLPTRMQYKINKKDLSHYASSLRPETLYQYPPDKI